METIIPSFWYAIVIAVFLAASIDTYHVVKSRFTNERAGFQISARYAADFKATYQRLITMPASGAPRPALGSKARIAVVLPYIVIYDHEDDLVTVLRVLHGKRNIATDLIR